MSNVPAADVNEVKAAVIEGTWEEIARQSSRFHGRRLRVVILPEAGEETEESAQDSASERLRTLNAWLTLPRPVPEPLLDDSRAVIYADSDR